MVSEKETLTDYDSMIAAGRRLIQDAEDDIVISGIAGDFPDCEGLTEFAEKLFNKVDLISDDDRRWKLDHPEIPQRTGKLKQVSKFDASSFGIHYNQAQAMDPMTRIILEKSYEAIIDAGVNPYSLKGSKTGVFIGACFSESEKTWFYEKLQVDGFGVTGCIRTMLANRISYAFGLDGPSYVVDTACSSSMYALEQGYNAIRQGHCEAAIVGGSNLCLHPYVSLQFARLGVLSFDGKCKVFDEAANGYCRSEAIAAVFLQKKKDSHRIYATLVHAKTNCDGYKEQGITYPSGEMQQKLLDEFYLECMVDPSTLAWVEAHGTGTKVGDPEEVRALYNVFCKNRKTPLKIGSVKSNLGHTEPSSGMCSIAKVIIAMESGLIPPNINFRTPRSDIEYFHTGEMEVVTEPTPWEGGLVGVNSFGFGGANCHALLRWNEKSKRNGGLPDDDIPRLVNVSGRTVEAVDTILSFIENSSLDAEFVKLLHDIHKDEIPSHLYRGYTIVTKNKSYSAKKIEPYGMRRPLYVLFSGLCNKWKPFDKSLLQFPIFNQSLQGMSKAVSIDLSQLITNPANNMSNPVDFMVAMVASQIALFDLLQYIGINPDGLIGISIGNLVCAYADGCLTADDAILIAYNLALILIESSEKTGKGRMQIFERNFQETDSKHLNLNLLSSAKPKIMNYLNKRLTNGRSNTKKWINASNNKGLNGIELLYENLFSSMNPNFNENYFSEECLLFCVGSKGLYDHLDLPVIDLLDNEGNDNTTSFLASVGKMYLGGVESDISKLYPKVEYPVSRSTPMIAPLVRWNHDDDWYVTTYRLQKKMGSGERTVSISLQEDETEYISGHVIDGRNLFPATGYLTLIWETIGLIKGEHYTEIPIVFEDVRFLRATNMPVDGNIDFTIIVQRASGIFEIIEGGAPIVTGRCYVPEDMNNEMSLLNVPLVCDEPCTILSKDIYKELRLRGYNYKGLFRSLNGLNIEGMFGSIRWQKNWVAFMDNMLQVQILQEDTRGLFVPTSIDRVVIDGCKHIQYVLSLPGDEEKDLTVYYHKDTQLIKSGGIELQGLRANAISRRKILAEAILEKYLFVPNHTESQIYNIEEIMRLYSQIILENENTVNVRGVELFDKEHTILSPVIALVLSELPLIQPELLVFGTPEISADEPLPPEVTVEEKAMSNDQTALLVVANNVFESSRDEVLQSCLNAIKPGGYIIARENLNTYPVDEKVTVLCSHIFNNERVFLLQKAKKTENIQTEVLYVSQDDYSWLSASQAALKSKDCKRIVFVGTNGKQNGVLGFVNCVRKEPDGQKAKCVLLMDENAPKFSLENQLYSTQLLKDMAVNVYKDGQWGTYRHLKLDSSRTVKCPHVYANVTTRGDLSSLSWIQGPITQKRLSETAKSGESFVNIHYSALNFRDIMLASGKLAPEVIVKDRMSQDCVIGFEYSGIHEDGSRVMGMAGCAALSSAITFDKNLSWKIPDHWSLEDAATVPCTYATVIFAMTVRGKIKKGDSILIHAGSGGVGQAAINIALLFGCTVFTTVGTPEKRKFIRETFPQIDDRHIGNSRDTSFEQLVMRETNGRGVDMVLNSLAEEKLLASVRCLAKGGRFLEIGKFDLSNNNPLGMEMFATGASFHGILLDAFFYGNEESKIQLHALLQEYLDSGKIKPLCRHVFDMEDLESAFRFMAAGKHIGKVLIKVKEEIRDEPSQNISLYDGIPRFYCNPESVYIIIGGLGGFGLELADWLILRGGLKLVLTSRKGITNGYQSYRMQVWKSYKAEVKILTDDVTTYEGVEKLLATSSSMGPVAGIFNLAAVLKDALFENQTEESFQTSLAPKAVATKYLDQLSRKMCPDLKHFVVFSSVSCGRGNAGQTNYGMANSIMERICEVRAAEGLPGMAIQWGAVGDVGLVAEMMEDHVEMVIGGTLQQRITSCLEMMDHFFAQNHPVVASMVVAEKKSGRASSDNIVDTVVNILGIRDLKTVSIHSNLAELGMDSMMAVEIKQTLEREFEVFLSPQDIRGMTIAKLQEIAAAKEAATSEEKSGESAEVTEPVQIEEYFKIIPPEPECYEPILKLETLASNSSEKKTRIFFIPGLEGFPICFEHVVKHLDAEAYGLQLDYTTYHNDLTAIADFFFPILLPYLIEKTFNLVGYSYGGLITLDLARRLEAMGYSGKIILIDSSPDLMEQYVKAQFSEKVDDNLQIQSILRVIDNSVKTGRKTEEIEAMLRESPDWDSRIEFVINATKAVSSVTLSDNYMRQLFNSGYNRVLAIYKENTLPEKCISAPVTLIRPTVNIYQLSSDDYGLSKYCKKPVILHFLDGDHFTILKNKKLVTLVSDALLNETTVCSKTSLLKPPTEIAVISEPTKQI